MMMQAEWLREARAVDSRGPVREDDRAKRRGKKVLTAKWVDCCCSSDATAHMHRDGCLAACMDSVLTGRECMMYQRLAVGLVYVAVVAGLVPLAIEVV